MTTGSNVTLVDLGRGVTFEVDRENGVVTTVYKDGPHPGTQYRCAATREDDAQNRAEAADQGYMAEAQGVWDSLVDHEILHTLVSRELFGRESYVLRHEAGAEPARYALRLHEEAAVISFQTWLNTTRRDPVLIAFHDHILNAMAHQLGALLAKAEQA